MRAFLTSLAIVLILVLAAAFLPVWKNGQPLVNFSDLGDWWESLRAGELPKLGADRDEPTLFYKWRDSAGQVHYSTEPPEAGVVYERVEIDPDVNTLPAVRDPSGDSAQ